MECASARKQRLKCGSIYPRRMADERLSIRRSTALHQQYSLLSHALSSYSLYDKNVTALVCAFASPTVCAAARPGDGDEHERPLRNCKRCGGAFCFPCSPRTFCTFCRWERVLCAPCAMSPIQCAACEVPTGRCEGCAYYAHILSDTDRHSPLCEACADVWRCALCGVSICATCPNRHGPPHPAEPLCAGCARPHKRKAET